MKRLVILFFLLPTFSFSQNDTLQKNSSGRYELSGIVNEESKSANELYSNAKNLLLSTLSQGKKLHNLKDDNSKTVVGKGVATMKIKISIGSPVYQPLDYTFTIQCKDKRYKYVISDFNFYNTGDLKSTKSLEDEDYWFKNNRSKTMWSDIREQVTEQMNGLIVLLKKSMSESNDW